MSAEQDEHDDALAEAGAAAARLGVELARFQLALDRLGRATTALREARATPPPPRPAPASRLAPLWIAETPDGVPEGHEWVPWLGTDPLTGWPWPSAILDRQPVSDAEVTWLRDRVRPFIRPGGLITVGWTGAVHGLDA